MHQCHNHHPGNCVHYLFSHCITHACFVAEHKGKLVRGLVLFTSWEKYFFFFSACVFCSHASSVIHRRMRNTHIDIHTHTHRVSLFVVLPSGSTDCSLPSTRVHLSPWHGCRVLRKHWLCSCHMFSSVYFPLVLSLICSLYLYLSRFATVFYGFLSDTLNVTLHCRKGRACFKKSVDLLELVQCVWCCGWTDTQWHRERGRTSRVCVSIC